MTASKPLLGTWKLISFQVATEDGDERTTFMRIPAASL